MVKSHSPLAIPLVIWISLSIDSLLMLLPLRSFLILHATLSLLIIFLCFQCAKQGRDLRFIIPYTLFLSLLGPPGGAIFAFSSLMNLLSSRCAEPLSALLNSLFLPIHEENSEIIYDRIIYHLDNPTPHRIPMPFADIMMYGNYNQKRMAIEKMLRYFTPAFTKPLKLGLNDPSAAIKVQTACALSSIDQTMFERYTTLKKKWQENKNRILMLKAFTSFGTYYALSGILESDRLTMILDECIPALIQLLRRRPADAEAKIELSKLYLLNGQNLEAKEVLEQLLKEKYNAQAADILMEVLYNLKEYEGISSLASYSNSIQEKNVVSPLTQLWAGEAYGAS